MSDRKERKTAGRVLAFDTSNYTTSVAVADLSGNILADCRKLLTVKEGERGLRQSHALFQHVKNLPELLRQAAEQAECRPEDICAVAVSSRPRPVEGSYMPVFLAGVSTAESIASVLGVVVYRYSHQEGHIAAAAGVSDESVRSVSFHMSGGTGEILDTRGCRPVAVIGGTRGLSFGQLIDRTGVALGFGFPAGTALDEIACRAVSEKRLSYSSRGNTKIENPVTKSVHTEGAYVDLSGIETQLLREIERWKMTEDQKRGGENKICRTEPAAEEKIVTELFCRIADALVKMSVHALQMTGTDLILFVGGVSASRFLREELTRRLASRGFRAVFGDPRMSPDNACGIARLGAAEYLRSSAGRLPK